VLLPLCVLVKTTQLPPSTIQNLKVQLNEAQFCKHTVWCTCTDAGVAELSTEVVSWLGLRPDTSSGNSGYVQHLAPIRRTSPIFQHHSDPILATLVAKIAASPLSRIRLPLLPLHPLVSFPVPLSHPISIQHAISIPLSPPIFHSAPCLRLLFSLVIITGFPGLTRLLVHHSIRLSQVSVSLSCITLHLVLYIVGSRGSECPQPEYRLCVILTSLRLQVPSLASGPSPAPPANSTTSRTYKHQH
jgi:hypothetical protein